tara:strand:+ start:841 stop:1578 length:738 start_codon:yes stop_codon:yes gene_type:complete
MVGNKMTSLIIHHHAGLGDHFMCNGVVNYIVDSTDFDYYYVLTKERNYKTVSEMYSYSDKIRTLAFSDEIEDTIQHRLPVNGRYIQIGFGYLENYMRENPDKDFSYAFYDQFDLPFSDKWDRFKIQRNEIEENKIYEQLVGDDEEYIFVHDVSSVGKYDLNIDSKLKIIKPKLGITNNTTHFLKVIENAKEVHCLDSSFISMIDLELTRENLFAHNVKTVEEGGTGSFPYFKNAWREISYEQENA